MKTTRTILQLLALLLAPALAAGAELVLAVSRTSLSLPIYVAEAQGYFKAEGAAVRLQECIGGMRCIKHLFDGTAQLATASDLPVMFHSFERRDYAVLATFVTSVNDMKLVVRRSAGIERPRQLTGKRIATVRGASPHYYLDAYLLYHGIDPAAVTMVALPPERMAEALARREVDAVTVWEPFAWLSVQAVGDDALVLPNPRIYTQSFNLLADRRTIAGRDDELVRVLRALDRAVRHIREQPQAAQALLKTRLQLDQRFIDWAWRDFDYRLGLDQSLVSTIENEARWAVREGHVQGRTAPPNVLDLLDPGPLRRAVPGAVTTIK